ncbi:MAG: hypothetical protein O2960_26000 [Verrucomicrobia bacterium]|nr:hypothetical protein [Verrucomicrobiota bacterium]
MDFIKKHYEKIFLSIVLLGLAGAAAALPLKVSSVREYLEEMQMDATRRSKPKPFKPIDLSTNQVIVKRSMDPGGFDFSTPHNIFNPVEWRKNQQTGGLIKIETGTEAGPGALVIEKINPLYLSVTFESVSGSGGDYRYLFTIVNETERGHGKVAAASLNVPNSYFLLRSVEGPADSPTAFRIILKGERETITITPEKPLSRIVGYSAELRYPLENSPAKAYKKDETIRVPRDPERYKIVAITQNEVVLSASSSEKRTTLIWKGAPKY